jgi:hypothetical protein
MSEFFTCVLCGLEFQAPDPEIMESKIKEHWPVCPMTAPGAQKGAEVLKRMMQMREDDEQRKQAREGN